MLTKHQQENTHLLKQLDIAAKKLADFEEWHKNTADEKQLLQAALRKQAELEAEIRLFAERKARRWVGDTQNYLSFTQSI